MAEMRGSVQYTMSQFHFIPFPTPLPMSFHSIQSHFYHRENMLTFVQHNVPRWTSLTYL
eukprot:UN01548